MSVQNNIAGGESVVLERPAAGICGLAFTRCHVQP